MTDVAGSPVQSPYATQGLQRLDPAGIAVILQKSSSGNIPEMAEALTAQKDCAKLLGPDVANALFDELKSHLYGNEKAAAFTLGRAIDVAANSASEKYCPEAGEELRVLLWNQWVAPLDPKVQMLVGAAMPLYDTIDPEPSPAKPSTPDASPAQWDPATAGYHLRHLLQL